MPNQPPLFGEPLPPPLEPPRLAMMHRRHGAKPGHTCGNCYHLQEHRYGRVIYKCGLSRSSMSAATDWRRKWPACGKWQAED
jgi:hypothetical protein